MAGNEGQQYAPHPQPGVPEQPQQQYYGWQYEQDQPISGSLWQYEQNPAVSTPPPLSALPSQPLSGQVQPPMYPPASPQFNTLRPFGPPSGPLSQASMSPGPLSQPLMPPGQAQQPRPVVPPQYQEPLLDMGSSLGYGQGMEYQYFNAPQPSQPMEVLRQTRLQQLRAERLRRVQEGWRNSAGAMQGKKTRSLSSLFGLFSGPTTPPVAPSKAETPQTPPWLSQAPTLPVTPPTPGIPLSPPSPPEVSTSAPAPLVPHSLPGRPLSLPSKPLPAVHAPETGTFVPKQDSGSMQKVNMARATLILTGSFIVGRVLGLLRTSLFAFVFGTTMTSDAYLQAFLVPDLIFNVVAGGALSSAFIPIFTHYMIGEKNEKKAWHVASSALNLALAIMCFLALIAMILAPRLVPIYTPDAPPAEVSLIVALTRIMLFQAIIMGGGVIVNSVLYARQNFLLPAIGTVLYNVGLITGLLPGVLLVFLGRTDAHTTIAVYAATVGVVLGAAFQVGIQIPGVIKERMRYTFTFDWKHPGVRQIGRQMLPRVLNATVLYFSTFVDRALILVFIAGQSGLITQYYQAFQLVLLPLGIFGMAVATAAFPTMAENVTRGRLDRVRTIIEDTLRSILFMSIPSSIGLIVLGLPIIQVLLQHGAFSLDDATSTSVPLACFALGLAGLASVEILTRSFYAFRDSKTPVIISISQFGLKILLSLILLNLIKWGPSWSLGCLAFSTALAGSLEAAALLWLLQKKIGMLGLRRLANFAGRVLLASLAMGAGLLLLRTLLDLVLITTFSQSLGFLGAIFAIFKLSVELLAGLLIYIWSSRQLGLEDFWKQGPVLRVLARFKLSWI
jgi:putative peptidoglycan lipid II flippase